MVLIEIGSWLGMSWYGAAGVVTPNIIFGGHNMTITIAHKNLERQLRRALNKHGYSLRKSRKPLNIVNLGEYMIVDTRYNAVVAGASFNLPLNDVADWLREMYSE